MKRIILTLVTVFSMCSLVACGGEKTNGANAGGKNDEPVVTAAPTSEPTVEPTVEPTAEPTPEPTADPVEELTALRDEALAAHSSIVEQVQYRFDIASEILEVAKGFSNFREDDYYQLLTIAKANFEENLLTWNVNSTVASSIALNMVISYLIEDIPELKTTEEFQKFVEAPALDTAVYNGKVAVYNSILSSSSVSGFEELPYCDEIDAPIEY